MEGTSTSIEVGGDIMMQLSKKEKRRQNEEASNSCSPSGKKLIHMIKDKERKQHAKRKKGKCLMEGNESSHVHLVRGKLMERDSFQGGGWQAAPPRAMKSFCWNCRKLENPAIVGELRQLLTATNPDIIFLYETKLRTNEFEKIRRRCKLDGCFVVDTVG